MKTTKRFLSLLLAVVMVVTIIPFGMIHSNAGATKHTVDEAMKYLDSLVGKQIEVNDAGYWTIYQCVDLVQKYYLYLGATNFTGSACNYATDNNAVPSGWKKIKGAAPQKGDVLIYSGYNKFGEFDQHVSIYVSDYVQYHQNFPYDGYDTPTGHNPNNYNNKVTKETRYKYTDLYAPYWGVIRPLWNDYKISKISHSNVTNTSATVSFEASPACNPSAWGVYLSAKKSDVDNTNSKVYKAVNNGKTKSVDLSRYFGDLKPNTTYYYKFLANMGGQNKASGTGSFKTTNVKPDPPQLGVAADSKDIGITGQPTITWKTVKNVSTYTAVLYDEAGNEVQKKEKIAKDATTYTFNPINEAGTYKAYIYAVNVVGETEGKPVGTIVVHPDVTVRFMDADPQSFVDFAEGSSTEAELLKEQTVHYGTGTTAPVIPHHEGYTFKKWDAKFDKVTEDITVTAVYTINSYKVNFVSETGAALYNEIVEYYSPAHPPVYTPSKDGYVFVCWNNDTAHILGDTTFTAVTDWYNKNYSVFAKIDSAKRDDDNKGYEVNVTLQNNALSLTTGRIVVVLKTSDGKMLAASESSAFSVKPDKSKSFEIFVPYENAAAKAYVYVVDTYKSMTPMAQEASKDVDMGLSWTSWSTEMPEEGSYDELESRTEYRYKTRSTTTSYATSLAGYTQNGHTLVKASSGDIDYISSWPSGYNKSDTYYKWWANRSLKSNSETATQKTVVSSKTIGYLYWHWCYPLAGNPGEYNRYMSDTYNEYINGCGNCTKWESYYVGSRQSWKSNVGAYEIHGHSSYTYWWNSWAAGNSKDLAVQRQTWTTYNKLYNYYQISDWSEWSTEQLSSYENVEQRTVYRYRPKDTSVEDTSGELRTISGNLGDDYAGKQLTLYIYKIEEASDYSNEYLGQTTVDENGAYSFNFKLREEPSIQTGDYTVALGLEGASSLMYLDKIEAPKQTFTVKFLDYDGTLLSTQEVIKGENAELPDAALYNHREGYTFSHWNYSNINIQSNLEIRAEYELNVYTVVFVDWEARTVQVKKFEHGAELVAPDFEEPENGVSVVWDKIATGVTEVTSDMVICTDYTTKSYNVTFKDFDNNLIETQHVDYGYAADVPQLEEEGIEFLGWANEETGELLDDYIVTSNLAVCPQYVFNETCDLVTGDVESGEYTAAQTVTLTTATEDAVIFYTLDGSDPHGRGARVYTEPIEIKDFATLRCYAGAIGKNDSGENVYHYVINPTATTSGYLRFEELPAYVREDAARYHVQQFNGYEFKNTVAVSKQADLASYATDGWLVEKTEQSDWSAWQDEPIAQDESFINFYIDTRIADYDVTGASYKYSRFAYTKNGETLYAPEEVEGFTGEWQYKEVLQTEGLPFGGFEGGKNYYKDADGTRWYNRETGTLTETKQKTQYRSCFDVVTVYQWTDDICLAIPAGESREHRIVDLFTYDYEKHFIVSISSQGENIPVVSNNSSRFIVTNHQKIPVENIYSPYGHNLAKLYKDTDLNDEWNVTNDVVTESMTLYATYTPQKFQVTFAYKDGTAIETQAVDYLGAAAAPAQIELPEGYIFLGWDSDAYEKVTEDTVIHARYVLENEYSTIAFTQEEVSLLAGTQLQLEAETSLPGKTVLWKSADNGVVSVDANGMVYGVDEGTATVTATVEDSGESATCTVKVLRNTDSKLNLALNSNLNKDSEGYLRELKVGSNTVSDVKYQFENNRDKLFFKNIKDEDLSESDLVGTGTTVSLISGLNVLDSKVFVVTADMTGDGLINNRDVAMLNLYLVGKNNPAAYQIAAVDVNGDGFVNNRDAAMIARYLVGKEKI